jgi:hypothetical protein
VAVLADGVTHTFDRSLAVWVIWTVPGSGLLYATLESQLAGITGDYAAILRILRHDTQPYQPMQPSGTALRAGAWSGGAFISAGRALQGGGVFGVADAQSVQGGGSVSGVPFHIHSNGTNGSTYGGFFVKVAAHPSSDTTLFDVSSGSTYVRVKMTSAGHIVSEFSSHGIPVGFDLTPSAGVTTGQWYWVFFDAGNNGSESVHLRLSGKVYNPDGSSPGLSTTDQFIPGGSNDDLTGVLGWGVSTSGSGYANFPTSSGNELSKLEYFSGAVDSATLVLTPPGSDPSVGSHVALYLCRQTIGTVTSITDSTSNAYNLTATSGSQIVADGPYA